MTHAFSDLLGRWPSLVALSGDLDLSYDTVAAWKRRNSVPADRWQQLADAARARGIQGVTVEALSSCVRPRKRATVANSAAAQEAR